jgi:hypothetical protein
MEVAVEHESGYVHRLLLQKACQSNADGRADYWVCCRCREDCMYFEEQL